MASQASDCRDELSRSLQRNQGEAEAIVTSIHSGALGQNRARSFNTYLQKFGQSFGDYIDFMMGRKNSWTRHLHEERPRGRKKLHWVDMGAGELTAITQLLERGFEFRIQPYKDLDYTSLKTVYGHEKIKVTGVDVTPPSASKILDRLKSLGGRFILGSLETVGKKIKKADLITDSEGPLFYGVGKLSDDLKKKGGISIKSWGPDEVLSFYLKKLHRKGRIFIHSGVGGRRTQIQLPNGDLISLNDWILSLPMVSVQRTTIDSNSPGVMIRKIPETKPKIPKLELVETRNDRPPIRLYRQLSE